VRREFTKKTKAAAFERSGGHCEKCTARLYPGHFHYDHRIPDALLGEPILENCSVLCDACHGAKTTGEDVPRITKARHQRYAHIGAKDKPRYRWPIRKFPSKRRMTDGSDGVG
jgi:5-methylcytosine-specific restriction endonuclease McrA